MVDSREGEYFNTNVVKKRLTIIDTLNNKEISVTEFKDQIDEILNTYKTDEFDKLDNTILPLSRFSVENYMDIKGFLRGFIAGVEFERRGLSIKVDEEELTEDEKDNIRLMKLGMAKESGIMEDVFEDDSPF